MPSDKSKSVSVPNLNVILDRVREQLTTGTPESKATNQASLEASLGLNERLFRGGLGASTPTSPLTEAQQDAYNLICEASRAGEGLTGSQICRRLGIDSESNFTTHYVPELKRHGIKNRRGLGYYHPDFFKLASG